MILKTILNVFSMFFFCFVLFFVFVFIFLFLFLRSHWAYSFNHTPHSSQYLYNGLSGDLNSPVH